MVAWIIGNGSLCDSVVDTKAKHEAGSSNVNNSGTSLQEKASLISPSPVLPVRPDSPLNSAPGSPVSPVPLQHYSPCSPSPVEDQTMVASSPVCPPALPEVPFFPAIPAPKPARRHGYFLAPMHFYFSEGVNERLIRARQAMREMNSPISFSTSNFLYFS